MLALSPTELADVRRLLAPFDAVVFGSRATGRSRRFSDLDVCIRSPITLGTLGGLREAFDESDLPFVVDLSRWEDLAPTFQAVVTRDGVALADDDSAPRPAR